MRYILILVGVIFTALVYFYSEEKVLTEEAILGSIILLSYYFFIGHLFSKEAIWRKFLGWLMIFVLTISQAIGASSYLCYDTVFAYGQASSLLNTNMSESSSMISSSPLVLIIFLFFLLLNYLVTKSIRLIKLKNKILKICILSLWILIPTISVAIKTSKHIGGESALAYFFRNSTFSRYRTLILAYEPNKEFQLLKSIKPDYSKLSTGLDAAETIVLVIGESARRQNMSIYGYERKTTPFLDAERNNLKIYNNMVSSAGITQLSVPLLLSNANPLTYSSNKTVVSDNIINLASYMGYETYWLSTQEEGNHYVSAVSNMANLADSANWYKGFDEILEGELFNLLKDKRQKKKFIILHINGSHSNACDRYPTDASYFKNGNEAIDCYDNSILYTDRLLNSISKLLKADNAALIYLSDHGEKFVNDKYIHADTKESSMIPYVIWYGSDIPASLRDLMVVDELSTLENNYWEIARLLGVKIDNTIQSKSSMLYLKSNMEAIEYRNLEN